MPDSQYNNKTIDASTKLYLKLNKTKIQVLKLHA